MSCVMKASYKTIFISLILFSCVRFYLKKTHANSKINNHQPIVFNGNSKKVLSMAAQYLPSNPIIVEAGAFDGKDTQLMAQFFPQGAIHTFEPDPDNFAK